MTLLKRMLDMLANFLMVLGGIAIVLMMLNVTADIITRNIFHIPIPGTLEFVSSYYMVAVVFLPLAYVQRTREHVMIELFTLKLPPRVTAFMDAVIYVACAIGLGFFAVATFGKAVEMTRINEMQFGVIDVIVWPARWLVPAGCGVMCLYMLLQATADFAWAIRNMQLPGRRDLESHSDMDLA